MLLTAGACGGDGPTEPVEAGGSMSFSYSGAESGSFSVTGPTKPYQDGVVAQRLPDPLNVVRVVGIRMRSATNADFLELLLPNVTTPRTIALGGECGSTITDCPIAAFGRDVSVALGMPDPGSAEGFFVFNSGTVIVTLVTSSRIAGTFEGTAASLTLGGVPREVTITDGKFDMQLVPFGEVP
ncbi:MAG: hypothetical protein WEA80_01550 [Gemmatimonadaceae bacterium]